MTLNGQDVLRVVAIERFKNHPFRFPLLLDKSLVLDVLGSAVVVRHDKIDVIRSEVEMDLSPVFERAIERELDRSLALYFFDVLGFNAHVQFKSVISLTLRMEFSADAFTPLRVVL